MIAWNSGRNDKTVLNLCTPETRKYIIRNIISSFRRIFFVVKSQMASKNNKKNKNINENQYQ